MTTIRIVTDSTADLPADVRKQFGIEMVPLQLSFGDETFLDTVTIDTDQFYKKLAVSDQLPKSSQPSTIAFKEMYERILTETPDAHIISIHLSASLSGTYQSAVIGSTMVEIDGGESHITVFDSKSASIGSGVLVLKAAEMAAAGSSKEQIIAAIEQLRSDTTIYFLVDTLEYLQKGGRIGKASAVIGSLLNIKPILTLDEDGVVSSIDKVRGLKKAMLRIIELLGQEFNSHEPVTVTFAYAERLEGAHEFNELLKANFNVQSTIYYELGPVIGTHAGPGTIGLFMHRV
jgi:DegV family protein with EDD domain